ncbi:MAG: family 1 encapsulin nanocompartment shell protein [Suipraeoptans sp.]
MDYLARESVELPEGFWSKLDETVVGAIKQTLTGRKFLPVFGPLGAGAAYVQVDSSDLSESEKDGFIKTTGRVTVELPLLYEDFEISWRDIESSEKSGFSLELATAIAGAKKLAKMEDTLLFYGNEFLGQSGLLNEKGTLKIKKSNWADGEGAYMDVAKALAMFSEKDILGRYSLVVSPDVYASLYRVVPGLGIIEMERISKLLDGRVYKSSALKAGTAFMVCSESQYIDIAVGKDFETAYLEARDMNHIFRIIETAALRLKNKEAVIRFE